ncbi:MAG: translocation/assembly module TamB domain-containing protein, partial [Acidobacteria bacterium]|nr:translocation/assembly module TamB domain-containing protein [Acidobacteriota bacterium]
MPLDAGAAPGTLDVDARLHLATLAGYAPRGTSLSADGTMTVQGRVTGTAAAIDPDVTITLEDALVLAPELGTPVTGLQLLARVVGGTASVERLAAVWGTARFESSARAPLAFFGALPIELPAATGGATLEARLTGLDPGAVPGAPAGISGRVDLQVNASAPSADPAAVDGRLTFDALELGFRGLTLAQQQPSVLVARAGAATVETLALTGSAGTVEATGTVALTGDRVIDVTAAGSLDLAALSVVTDALRATGPMRFDVHAAGPAAKPQLQGFAELADGSVVIDDPAAVAIEDLAARLDLAGERVTLTNLSGLVNGGALTGSGTVTLGENLVADADLQLAVDDLAFSAPLDLRSLSDVGLRLTRRGDTFVVGGDVRINEAGLTGDINFDTGVLGVIGRPRGLDLTAERNALLERVRFDVHVGTETPILLDNNLAKAELTTDVRVLGTPYDLGMSGRMELLEGSTVTLNERRYEVERGLITFTDDTRITPSFDLRLTTEARHYDITLGVSGEVGATETTLTANPSLPEPDIMALLVTGRTLDDMRGAEYDVAREQVLSYLTGRVGSTLGRGLERATGLSEVRVEPTLIASETDPGARLTVGQELSDGLRLVYSTDLADSSNQIWLAEYDLTRRFSTRAVRQRDNTYRVEFRHDVRFGGAPEPRRMPRVRPVITTVAVRVDEGGDGDRLRERLKLKPGDPYDFFAAREGLDRIAETLRNEGFLQSRARIRRSPAPAPAPAAAGAEGVALAVEVTRGPRVRFQFDGAVPPGDVQRDLAVRWQRGVFDSQRSGDAADAVQAWLMGDRHMDPRIDVTVEDPGPDVRVVRLAIVPGPKFAKVTLAFEGARGIDPKVLDDIVRDQDLEEDLFTDPTVVTELLRRYYREEGYLAAALDQPERQFQGDTARVVIRVTEGPRFVVTGITPTGNTAVADAPLLEEAPLRPGDPFLPAVAERSLERIRQLYWRRGYNDVQLRYDVDADRETGAAAVSIEVREGARAVVNTVAVTGTDRTSDDLVVGQLEVYPEGVLDVAALGRSRRNLYATGAYSIVEFARTPAAAPADAATSTSTSAGGGSSDGGAPAPTAPAQAGPAATGDAPVDVHVTVREVQPFQLGYGASFDTERGPGGVLELTNSNSLGAARQVGISTRYDSQLRQARAYISQPFLKRFPLQTTAAVYLRQERNPLTELTQAFDLDRIGASLQQERRLANQYVWNYGVRWEQAR